MSVEHDRAKRMWEYLLAMGFRIVAFPISVWLLLNDLVVVGIILGLAAIIIPSIAVALANNVDHRGTSSAPRSPGTPTPRLDPGTHPEAGAPGGEDRDGEDTDGPDIPGTVISSHLTQHRPGHDPHDETGGAS